MDGRRADSSVGAVAAVTEVSNDVGGSSSDDVSDMMDYVRKMSTLPRRNYTAHTFPKKSE